ALAVRTAVERNNPGHSLELVNDHEVVLRLEELHGVARQHSAWETGGHAEVAGRVMTRGAGARFQKRFAARLERREPRAIEKGLPRSSALVTLEVGRPLVRAGKVRLSVRRSGDGSG